MLRLLITIFVVLLCSVGLVNANEQRLLQPGDVLFISFPGEDAFNEEVSIDVDGKIRVPELGLFAVAGNDLAQAEEKLQQLLSLLYVNVETVSVTLRQANVMVQVRGYVREPGLVVIPDRGNVQTAIQQAGGLIPGAQLDRMQLRRDNLTIEFSFKDYLDTGEEKILPALESMDTVFVPASPLTGNVQIEFDAQTLSAGGDAGDTESSYRIFGEVKSAGRYSLKADMSVIDAIMRAGGVTRFAGVEQIRVISSGEPTTFNLKQYLETGDESKLPRLPANSTIFVPIQEEEIKTGSNVVYVMGEVFKPGAFESKEGAGFLDILANAGGPTRFAESRQIRILHGDGRVTPFDLVAFTESGQVSELPAVVPGDAIFIPEKTDTNESSWLKTPPSRAIYVMGEVLNPGRFEWSDEMSMMDLLSHAEGPTANADIANIRVLSKQSDGSVTTRLFDLDEYIRLGGRAADLPVLSAGDAVIIPELPQEPNDDKSSWLKQAKEDSIYVFGQVGSPGRYKFDENFTFLDILSAADGPTAAADIHHIRIVHRQGTHTDYQQFNLAEYFTSGDEWILPVVKPGDAIFVPEKNPNWLDVPRDSVVKVIGAVQKPGRYHFNDSMTILDLLAEAGGPMESAYLKKILVLNSSRLETRSVSFNLIRFLKKPDPADLPVIRAGDTVFIPEQSESAWAKTMDGVRDLLSLLSVVVIAGAL